METEQQVLHMVRKNYHKNIAESLSEFTLPEKWIAIKEFGGRYLLSSYGRIISLFETGRNQNGYFKNEKISFLKPRICELGGNSNKKTRYVNLTFVNNEYNEFARGVRLDMLVAEHFLGCNGRKKLQHIDGDLLNCKVDNLRFKGFGFAKAVYLDYLRKQLPTCNGSTEKVKRIIEYLENGTPIDDILQNIYHDVYFSSLMFSKDWLPRKKNIEDFAKDVTQDTMIDGFQAIRDGRFNGVHNVEGWFIRCAKNKIKHEAASFSNRMVCFEDGITEKYIKQ